MTLTLTPLKSLSRLTSVTLPTVNPWYLIKVLPTSMPAALGKWILISTPDSLMLFIPSQAPSIKATIGNNHIGEKSFFFTTFGDSICVIMRFQTVP